MNLMNDPWIPVRCADGSTRRIRPHELTVADNPVVALEAPRPDFNGALAQFLIGLLQTVCAPADEEQWEDWLWSPPAPDTLAQRFAPLAPCFQLDGDGPRFMQDFDVNMEGKENPIAALLIEAPGEKTLKENADHFIKSETVKAICPACAAIALFTLQANAPSGGQGNRTSLRGGGPLTTLLIFDARILREPALLWRDLWLNVFVKKEFLVKYSGKDEEAIWFSWLSPTRTSEKNQRVTPADENAHPAIVYWATPRRILLNFDNFIQGDCDLCGTDTENLLQNYTNHNHGANYLDWIHPLSPYYRKNPTTSEWLPLHPQSDKLNYRYWLGCVLDNEKTGRIAQVVSVFQAQRQHYLLGSQFLVWVFGYDMDNMKARCWYESRLPLFELTNESQRLLLAGFAQQWVEAADEVRKLLFLSLKQAWFKRSGDAKGGMSAIELVFWNHTESAFYDGLRLFADSLQVGGDVQDLQVSLNKGWHTTLTQQALALFDYWATASEWEYENPQRLADAYHTLRRGLYSNTLKSKLGLASPPDPKNRKGKKRKTP